jgi:hypothetical protein
LKVYYRYTYAPNFLKKLQVRHAIRSIPMLSTIGREKNSFFFFFQKKAYGDAIEHGKKYEAEAFAAYAMSCSDIVVSAGFVICKKFPWLGYSPDGIVVNSSGVPQKLLEIKCPVKGKHCL